MLEIVDYYAQGLDKRKDVVRLHEKVKEELKIWTTRANNAKPGTPAASDAPRKRDLWAKAKLIFSTEAGRQKYDAELTAWQNSVDAQRAKGQADQLAKDFASATETVLELVARAWEELDKGNLQGASQVASKAMRVDASHWEAYLIAGIASFRQNDFEESMSCMRQAARLNPDNAQVFSGLGELYERQDNWQEAFKHFSKAIALAPDDIDYKIRAGFVCVKAEAPDQGIELLRKALVIDPDHQGAKWALGVALADSAQLGWTEVEDGHPRVPPGWYAMSREQALQAVRKLHEATALDLKDPELTQHLVSLKSDVDSNVKRHFTGSWVLFCAMVIITIITGMNIGTNGQVFQTILMTLAAGLFTATYFMVNLVPQYATNARILDGEHALKRGFFDWLENLQNPAIKLFILMTLCCFLPIFMIYWGIKNWTGENAPLGDALKDIRGASPSNRNGAQDLQNETDNSTNQIDRSKIEVEKNIKNILNFSSSFLNKLNKKIIIILSAVFLLLIILFVVYYFFNSKKLAQQSPIYSQSSVPSTTPAPVNSGGMPMTLESHWLGKWKTADSKKTIEITPQKITIMTDEWKRTAEDQTIRFDLTWTANRELKEGEFGYSGKSTSPSEIQRNFGEALSSFLKGSPDFSVSPTDAYAASRWIAQLAPRDYKILHGYGGGDSLPTEWIVDEYGNMLEVNAGHYGFHLKFLQRSNEEVSNSVISSTQSTSNSSSTDVILSPTVKVGDTYTYETLDMIEPKLNNVTTREIIDVNSNGFVMAFVNAKSKYKRRLFYDHNMNLLSIRSGKNDGINYSPALQYFKFPMKSGESWSSTTTETNIKTGKTRTHKLNGSVGGLEQITVQSGTFQAFRITIQSELNDSGQISTGQDISWYSPDARRSVMTESKSRDSMGNIGHRRISLISYHLATTAKSKLKEKRSASGKPTVQPPQMPTPMPMQIPVSLPLTNNPQPEPQVVTSKQVVSTKTLDEAYRKRISTECPQGYIPGLVCREKVRWQLCEGKWSSDPVPGQITCKGSAVNKN